jgi:glycosyltransferase involved in cell wall biosynthesis
VGILGHEFVAWAGGLDYLRLMCSCLNASGAHVELHFLLPDRGPRAAAPVPHRTGIPWVAHVYDFQHHHLAHYFSARDIRVRDHNFGRLLDDAPVVIFNSAAVIADARKLRPQPAARILQLPLCAAPVDGWFDIDVAQAQAAHGLHQPYFIVCNQFWLHKDHRTAFEAFARLADRHPQVELVCTGATSDPRNPRHLEELQALLKARGVESRVHILGLIAKQDQIALLRGALALVQPSLSEGTPGGLASYDAVALGVPVLLSDTPVNLELREPGTAFFRAGDADDMARVMHERLLAGPAPAVPREELVRRGQARRAAFGQALLEAIRYARG